MRSKTFNHLACPIVIWPSTRDSERNSENPCSAVPQFGPILLLILLILPKTIFGDNGDWEFHHFETPEGPLIERISDIEEDLQGRIWVATWGGGLHRLDQSRWRRWGIDDYNELKWTKSLAVDREGTVWAATVEGLWKFQGNAWSECELDEEMSTLERERRGISLIRPIDSGELLICDMSGRILT